MCLEDFVLVAERRWPRVSMIALQHAERCTGCSSVSSPADWQLFSVFICAEGDKSIKTFVSMLTPLRAPAADSACLPLAAQQLAHQMTVKWPCMHAFLLSRMERLDGLGMEIVSQLVKGTWTSLVYLDLMDCDLRAPDFLVLSQGNWPGLKSLDVSHNCLDAEGMASLAKGNWPVLMCFSLGSNPTLDAAAIAHVSAANWPIRLLDLSHNRVSTDMAAELADLQLPNLMHLYLTNTALTAAAVSELARADWPILKYLTLGHDDLDAMGGPLGLDLDKLQEPKSEGPDGAIVHQRNMVSQPGGLGLWPNLNHVKIWKHCVVELSDEVN